MKASLDHYIGRKIQGLSENTDEGTFDVVLEGGIIVRLYDSDDIDFLKTAESTINTVDAGYTTPNVHHFQTVTFAADATRMVLGKKGSEEIIQLSFKPMEYAVVDPRYDEPQFPQRFEEYEDSTPPAPDTVDEPTPPEEEE